MIIQTLHMVDAYKNILLWVLNFVHVRDMLMKECR